MEKKVSFWAYASNNAENLYDGDCFEECLLKNLEKSKKYGLEKEMMILIKHLKEKKSNMHNQDALNELFQTEIFLDYDFALKLNRLDIIDSYVFRYKTDIGKAIKSLLEYCEMRFVLEKRTWISENEICLDFEATHEEFDSQCIFNIQNGKYS